MSDKDAVIEKIRAAFGENDYPGDQYLQGSSEGCEPLEEVGPFQGRVDWQEIEPEFLDAHGVALSFFSEAGFRFFLPAYLIADVQGRLQYAEPLFHLTHGFSEGEVEAPTKDRIFRIKFGKSQFVNPRRYGAMTSYDYARYRLSVFTREEARAIVAYLQFKRRADAMEGERIDAALTGFWLERARSAPESASLKRYVREQEDYLAAIMEGKGE
jgi:hypothetical protein